MDYKVIRIKQAKRYEKVETITCPKTGVILTKIRDKFTGKEILTFKSKEDAEKYYEPWVGHDKEALEFYVDSAILTSKYENEIPYEVVEFELNGEKRYQPAVSVFKRFSWGDCGLKFGVNYPEDNYCQYPANWFFLNEPFAPEDKLTIGVGSVINMGKSYKTQMFIDDFMKLMMIKGKFYTPYLFKDNKRNKENAYIEENSITLLCIDIDDNEKIYDLFQTKEGNEYKNSLLNRTTYYLQQISKSGEGLHIFIPVKVRNTEQLNKIINYMQLEMEGIGDISIYEPARLIFSSPYKIKEISKVIVARDFFINPELTQKEPFQERKTRIESFQLTKESRKKYVKNSGRLQIRTYLDGSKLVKWFEDKFGKLTTKKLFSVQVKEKSDSNSILNKSINLDEFKIVAKVNNSSKKTKTTTKAYVTGLIPFINALAEKVGFSFKKFESYTEKGVKKVYYQISLSPDENTPMDCFWYLDNPEFIYFQSENSIRHIKELEFRISYTTQKRPVLHISNMVSLLWKIAKNFNPEFKRSEFIALTKKYQLHSKYIYSHFEEVEDYIVDMITELKNNGNKPVKINKFIPKKVISTSKVWKAMRRELEKLGFVFKRTLSGLVCYYNEIDRENLEVDCWKGLPPKLRKVLREFFEVLNETWYVEIIENKLAHAWLVNQYWWKDKYIFQCIEQWEKVFKRRLEENEYVFWIDSGKVGNAKSYILTKLTA